MPLTESFNNIVQTRISADPAYRQALLREAVECFLQADLETGKALLRSYLQATSGYTELERRTNMTSVSIARILESGSNPSAQDLSTIVTALQQAEGIRFELVAAERDPDF